MKGSYLLVFRLDTDMHRLPIGRLGCFDFPAGYYLYVGSAFGAGGLPARLAYHQRRHKDHPHWHIDYLRPAMHLLEAWTVGGPLRLECVWCGALADIPGLQIPVRGFGSRDTHCAAHLFYMPQRPRVHALTHTLLADLPLNGHDVLELQIEIHLFDDAQ